MNRFTYSHPDVALPKRNGEDALNSSQYRSLEMSRNEANGEVRKTAWEVLLNGKSDRWFGKVAAVGNEKASASKESRQIENCHTNEQGVIARELKSAVNELVTMELAKMG